MPTLFQTNRCSGIKKGLTIGEGRKEKDLNGSGGGKHGSHSLLKENDYAWPADHR
jgi:hypothetical protein